MYDPGPFADENCEMQLKAPEADRNFFFVNKIKDKNERWLFPISGPFPASCFF